VRERDSERAREKEDGQGERERGRERERYSPPRDREIGTHTRREKGSREGIQDDFGEVGKELIPNLCILLSVFFAFQKKKAPRIQETIGKLSLALFNLSTAPSYLHKENQPPSLSLSLFLPPSLSLSLVTSPSSLPWHVAQAPSWKASFFDSPSSSALAW